ncbi:MAG: 1-acyl-sn-glycerol-3-phosphate acyltransferase [Desulfovibrio sp.]|nr:1-acyl-sn-glycerol-3-phosphate acyltransferase [Desulfovibrio sp.]MBI4961232.1 1-acyl-sn-glycerol-3-phosphate acyltransferase [Desulfovibrio sp.]
MVYIHKALFFLFVLPLMGVVSFLCLLTAWIGENSIVAHTIARHGSSFLLYLSGVRVHADLSRLDPRATYAFMANHSSQFDIVVLFATLNRWNVRFVAKESLARVFLFGHALKRMGHIPIARENSRKAMKAIDQAADACGRGMSVVIFPEGTRSSAGDKLGDFRIGGMIMALKCNVPVAPVILTGTERIMPRGAFLPTPGEVRVEALEPFDPSEKFTMREREEFRAWFWNLMDSAYQERKNQAQR